MLQKTDSHFLNNGFNKEYFIVLTCNLLRVRFFRISYVFSLEQMFIGTHTYTFPTVVRQISKRISRGVLIFQYF